MTFSLVRVAPDVVLTFIVPLSVMTPSDQSSVERDLKSSHSFSNVSTRCVVRMRLLLSAIDVTLRVWLKFFNVATLTAPDVKSVALITLGSQSLVSMLQIPMFLNPVMELLALTQL